MIHKIIINLKGTCTGWQPVSLFIAVLLVKAVPFFVTDMGNCPHRKEMYHLKKRKDMQAETYLEGGDGIRRANKGGWLDVIQDGSACISCCS